MSNKTFTLPDTLYDYLSSVSLRETALLHQLRAETARFPYATMQIAPEEGQFLSFLVQLTKASKILEIGVFTGYSSLCMALAMPEYGKLIACDVNKEWTEIARKYWRKAGIDHKIDLRIAPALKTLDHLIASGEAGSFDFIFIDADKTNYISYYSRAIELARTGGVIAIDNVFWSGKVADLEQQDEDTKAIRSLNEQIYNDNRVFLSMIPIADGLTLALKR